MIDRPTYIRYDFDAVNAAVFAGQSRTEESVKARKYKNFSALSRTILIALAVVALLSIIIFSLFRMGGTSSSQSSGASAMQLGSPGESSTGSAIQRRYTVFDHVSLPDGGHVVTGKEYSGVSSTVPYRQYCYLQLSDDLNIKANRYNTRTLSEVIDNTRVDELGRDEALLELCQFEIQ